jgi:DNA primase
VCGFQGDQIDLLAKVQGVSRVQAAEYLAGVSAKSLPKTVRVYAPQRKAPVKIVQEWQSESWQSEAKAIIEAGELRIQSQERPKEFLWDTRRIGLTTAHRFSLGYDPEVFDPATKSKRPAIIIPWLDQAGNVTAIKYRFIDELAAQDKGRRFFQKKGSQSTLFGLNACHSGPDSYPYRVVIVEGEFNAIAIAQTMTYAADVFSVGSQGNSKGLEFALKYCERFPGVNVMLWFDEEKQVKEAFKLFPNGKGFKSPYALDANDILKTYGAFELKRVIEAVCPTSVYNRTRPIVPML